MPDLLFNTTMDLWEISVALSIQFMWIVYLIKEKTKVDHKNERLVEALSDLTVTISQSVNSISNMNTDLLDKIKDQITSLRELITEKLK